MPNFVNVELKKDNFHRLSGPDDEYLAKALFTSDTKIKFKPGQAFTFQMHYPGIEKDVQHPDRLKKYSDDDRLWLSRAYSIASPPGLISPDGNSFAYEVYVIRVDDEGERIKDENDNNKGAFTTPLFSQDQNIEYRIIGRPTGALTLEYDEQDKILNDVDLILMAGTGTGSAPYPPILEFLYNSAKKNNVDVKELVNGIKLVGLMGGKDSYDHSAYEDLFTERFEQMGGLYIQVKSREDSNIPENYLERVLFNSPTGNTGRIVRTDVDDELLQATAKGSVAFKNTRLEKILGGPIDWNRALIFACGRPDMIETLEFFAKHLGAEFRKDPYWKE